MNSPGHLRGYGGQKEPRWADCQWRSGRNPNPRSALWAYCTKRRVQFHKPPKGNTQMVSHTCRGCKRRPSVSRPGTPWQNVRLVQTGREARYGSATVGGQRRIAGQDVD